MGKKMSEKKCNDCKQMRKGDCCGFGGACEFFEAAYNVPKSEMVLWKGNMERATSPKTRNVSHTRRLRGEFKLYKALSVL